MTCQCQYINRKECYLDVAISIMCRECSCIFDGIPVMIHDLQAAPAELVCSAKVLSQLHHCFKIVCLNLCSTPQVRSVRVDVLYGLKMKSFLLWGGVNLNLDKKLGSFKSCIGLDFLICLYSCYYQYVSIPVIVKTVF